MEPMEPVWNAFDLAVFGLAWRSDKPAGARPVIAHETQECDPRPFRGVLSHCKRGSLDPRGDPLFGFAHTRDRSHWPSRGRDVTWEECTLSSAPNIMAKLVAHAGRRLGHHGQGSWNG